jgi:hypothetical protein
LTDLAREYGKNSAFSAAAAFVLSFIVGLFSRNIFGVVLLRAFLLAIVFAALGAAYTFIIKKYLPELLGTSPENPAPDAQRREKRTVDIVLPEENPMAAGLGPDMGAEGSTETLEDAESAGLETVESADFSEEPPLASTGVPQEQAEPFGVVAAEELGEEAVEDFIDVESGEEEAPPVIEETEVPAAGRRASEGLEDLDNLPDIADIGSLGGAPRASPRKTEKIRLKPEETAHGFVADEDPESLAKAIRTVMKRDERG